MPNKNYCPVVDISYYQCRVLIPKDNRLTLNKRLMSAVVIDTSSNHKLLVTLFQIQFRKQLWTRHTRAQSLLTKPKKHEKKKIHYEI